MAIKVTFLLEYREAVRVDTFTIFLKRLFKVFTFTVVASFLT